MKISELKDKSKVDVIELRIFSAKFGPRAFPDKKITGKINMIQQVLVADKDSIKDDGSLTGKLDIDVTKYPNLKEGDNVRITDAWCTLVPYKDVMQPKITNAHKIEKI